MHKTRFDSVSKLLAKRQSRRSAIKRSVAGLGAAVVGGSLGLPASAQGSTPAATPELAGGEGPEFLFVQTATSGTFTPNPGADTPAAAGTPIPGGGADYLLTLEGHGGGTVYFSDRPERIFGEAPTQTFLDGLGFSPENPPNAALVTQTPDGTDEVVVMELLNPTYDESVGTVTYGATILDEYTGPGLAHVATQQQDAELPETLGRSSLFIDDCSDKYVYCIVNRVQVPDGEPTDVGNHGFCWSWSDFQCLPCGGGWSAMTQLCNDMNPDDCQGHCTAMADGPTG